jgi:hypothetical protein
MEHTRQEIWKAASAAMRSLPIRRADANSGRDGIIPVPMPQWERTLL